MMPKKLTLEQVMEVEAHGLSIGKSAFLLDVAVATLQDFDKAKWYVNREISRLERVNEVPHYAYELDQVYNKISQYYKDYEFDKRLCDFIRNMIHGGEDSLLFAIKIIDSWIKELDK